MEAIYAIDVNNGLSKNGNGSISILNNGYGYAPNDNLWYCGCC